MANIEEPAMSSNGPRITELPDDNNLDLIVLMGATGSGKSTFINLLAGSTLAQVGHNSESCTHDMQQVNLQMDNRSVTIIDSPGFDDTYQTDYEILRKISEWLTVTYKNGVRVTGIIYLREITESRMRGSTLKNFTMFTKLCGTETLTNVCFVTTKWDVCLREQAEARQEEMRTKFLKSELEMGAKLKHHDNSIQSACEIIRGLLGNPPTVLKIQRDLVDDEKPLRDTDAGEELNTALTKEREKWAKEYADGLRAVEETHSARMKQMLEETNAKYKEELDRIDEQMKALDEEGERARQQRVGALETMVADRAAESGQTGAAFLKDVFTTLAPVLVPVAVHAYQKHASHQENMAKHAASAAEAQAESQRQAAQAQAESQRKSEAAQLQMIEAHQRILDTQERLNQTQQARQPPVVLGPLASLFHVLSL